MRQRLKNFHNQMISVEGTIVRRGKSTKKQGKYPTVLLEDLVSSETGRSLTDHVWASNIKFRGIPKNTRVQFLAKVVEYEKGYDHKRRDYNFDVLVAGIISHTQPKDHSWFQRFFKFW